MLLTFSIVCNALLLVLWLLARNDRKHERAKLEELAEWKQEATKLLLEYHDAANLLPLEIGDKRSEAVYQFIRSRVSDESVSFSRLN